MAKRLTDSEKWKDRFFFGLKPEYKFLWFYIWDNCDHAGIWSVNFDLARFHLKNDVSEDEALIQFGDKVKPIADNKWFIRDFLIFQYGKKLNPKSTVHKGVLRSLYDNGVDCDEFLFGAELPWKVLEETE